MRTKISSTLLVGLAVLLTAGLAAQDPEFSARDVFRKAKNRFYVAEETKPAPASAGRPAAPRPAEPVAQAAQPTPPKRTPTPAQPDRRTSPSEEPQVIQASLTEEEPLSLRYSIQRRSADGSVEEVDPDAAFKSGDSIRVTVESSDDASLYIVSQGSSGKWNVLFPSVQIAGGANRIDPFQTYMIPPGGWFSFDETVGKERLFIMLSRKPVEDLEKLIYTLREDSPQKTGGTMMIAQNMQQIDDSMIMGIREVYTRDLVFEKVNDQPAAASTAAPVAQSGAAPKAETAMYVATKTVGDAARVVADVALNHR